jgi:hypothetical protein
MDPGDDAMADAATHTSETNTSQTNSSETGTDSDTAVTHAVLGDTGELDPAELDPTELDAELDATTAPQVRQAAVPDEAPRPEPTPAEPRRMRQLWLALALFVALLIGAAAFGAVVSPGTGPSRGAAPHSQPPTNGAPSAVAPVSPTLVLPSGPVRPADALGPWAVQISDRIDVPEVAVQAYAYAQLLMESTAPACHLSWTTLAGIGSVQSNNGRSGGAVLEQNGRTNPPLIGPALDGQDGRPLVPDTDAGAFDGDPQFDHGMGPLMLLPSQWQAHESDGDDDQIMDPYDIDDESLAAARLLCANGADLSTLTGWKAAVGQIKVGDDFANAVFQAADSYGQRTKDIE